MNVFSRFKGFSLTVTLRQKFSGVTPRSMEYKGEGIDPARPNI